MPFFRIEIRVSNNKPLDLYPIQYIIDYVLYLAIGCVCVCVCSACHVANFLFHLMIVNRSEWLLFFVVVDDVLAVSFLLALNWSICLTLLLVRRLSGHYSFERPSTLFHISRRRLLFISGVLTCSFFLRTHSNISLSIHSSLSLHSTSYPPTGNNALHSTYKRLILRNIDQTHFLCLVCMWACYSFFFHFANI